MVRNKNKRRIFKYNRRIRGLTDYRKRLSYLKSGLTRLVIRKSNKGIVVQFVDYDPKGDHVITSARAVDLKKLGYTLNTGNIVAAYLTGYLAGKRLLAKAKDKVCIVDIGLSISYRKGRLFAAVKGAIDAGVNVRVGDEGIQISEDRIAGKHLNAKDVDKIVKKVMSNIK